MVRPITITSTLYCLLFLLYSLGLLRTSDSCTRGDADALLRFMNAVNITSLKKGWGSSNSNGSCCDWEGVSCDAVSTQIVGISLSSKGLSGRLSQGLANIPSLQVLNVSNNHLDGPLPKDLSTLSSLHTLDVSSNNFSGQLSDVLLNFSSLQVINLSTNGFNGSLPSSSLRNLGLLRKFLASNNGFKWRFATHPMPNCPTSSRDGSILQQFLRNNLKRYWTLWLSPSIRSW